LPYLAQDEELLCSIFKTDIAVPDTKPLTINDYNDVTPFVIKAKL
jgi:hypothetical protein